LSVLTWLIHCVAFPPLTCFCFVMLSAVSAVLKSLQCYNDFTSYFHCTWRNEPKRQSNQTLKLWLKAKNARTGLCEEYPSAAEGTSECRYKTKIFSLGTTYTAFFNETVRFCSSGRPTSLDLSTLLRARAPVNLTTSSSHGGDLITWSSPYPQSSALNNNITYELSYRADGHDWTLRDNQKKLDKEELSPGHRHEARVRSRVRLGQWSHWSPTVSWYTQPDAETAPPVDCVLWGEQKVQCRWEQSIELVHLISYQLVCRHNHTLEKWTDCCEESTSSLKHQGDTDLGILHIPQGSSSGTILGRSVRPSHRYRVKVRTHVLRPYEGMPSDWSAPVDWTSHAGNHKKTPKNMYLFIFICTEKDTQTLFFWSKLVKYRKCKEKNKKKSLTPSSSSSYVSLRSNKNPDPPQAEQTQRAEEDEDTEEEEEEVDEGVWSCENIPVSPLSKGSMTFTGPYILCQVRATELSCPDVGRPAAVRTVSLEEGYVRLPSHTLHRSVQDLLSQTCDIEERSIYSTEETQLCLSGDSKTLWPQGGAIQGSGYCQLCPT
uniref:Fibronectin type-III domain-containing protein n=1 Tax=Periophthalmus magnuspinnatus TaxID=409849 RepID=A0A3B4ABN4_9GOBI